MKTSAPLLALLLCACASTPPEDPVRYLQFREGNGPVQIEIDLATSDRCRGALTGFTGREDPAFPGLRASCGKTSAGKSLRYSATMYWKSVNIGWSLQTLTLPLCYRIVSHLMQSDQGIGPGDPLVPCAATSS